MFNLLPSGALEGELEGCWSDFRGDCLLGPCWGGLKTIFLLEPAFFNGRSGDIFLVVVGCAEGIGAVSKDAMGSW
jgi:hypothetical protein